MLSIGPTETFVMRQGAEVAAGGGAAGVRMSAVGVEDVHDRGAYGPPQTPWPPVVTRRNPSGLTMVPPPTTVAA